MDPTISVMHIPRRSNTSFGVSTCRYANVADILIDEALSRRGEPKAGRGDNLLRSHNDAVLKHGWREYPARNEHNGKQEVTQSPRFALAETDQAKN
jgi:hypothetical protein